MGGSGGGGGGSSKLFKYKASRDRNQKFMTVIRN